MWPSTLGRVPSIHIHIFFFSISNFCFPLFAFFPFNFDFDCLILYFSKFAPGWECHIVNSRCILTTKTPNDYLILLLTQRTVHTIKPQQTGMWLNDGKTKKKTPIYYFLFIFPSYFRCFHSRRLFSRQKLFRIILFHTMRSFSTGCHYIVPNTVFNLSQRLFITITVTPLVMATVWCVVAWAQFISPFQW